MASTRSWLSLYKEHFDLQKYLHEFFTVESGCLPDSVVQPMKQVERVFTSGLVKGDLMIAYGLYVHSHLLFSACDTFKEIIIIDFLDCEVQHTKKWIKKHPTAFSWKRSMESAYESEQERKKWSEKEEKSRGLITQVLKGEVTEKGLKAPKPLPQADCVFCPYILNRLCQGDDAFIASVRNMSLLLKVGGHLLMHVFINATFFMHEDFKFPLLCTDAEFVKKVLSDSGFIINDTELNERKTSKLSHIDFDTIMFIFASKERDVC
ncbi:nicotinamide N-methyltransferase-like [Ambystoma mexicanum]|uniref:nicotinamide N-methyltransferase-like n=1 Tax=Ambystoma mexicanum TaxID=8296 RepID=UPI0037E790BC